MQRYTLLYIMSIIMMTLSNSKSTTDVTVEHIIAPFAPFAISKTRELEEEKRTVETHYESTQKIQ